MCIQAHGIPHRDKALKICFWFSCLVILSTINTLLLATQKWYVIYMDVCAYVQQLATELTLLMVSSVKLNPITRAGSITMALE